MKKYILFLLIIVTFTCKGQKANTVKFDNHYRFVLDTAFDIKNKRSDTFKVILFYIDTTKFSASSSIYVKPFTYWMYGYAVESWNYMNYKCEYLDVYKNKLPANIVLYQSIKLTP